MIEAGQRLPDATFSVMSEDGPKHKTSTELFKNKRVVLVAVPGAFTPTCHKNHMPGYAKHADAFLDKGIDAIYVTAVNDVFVISEWEKASDTKGKITFLSDGNADFAKAVGLSSDFSQFGMGTRSQRYSMVVNDGVVEKLNVEKPGGAVDVSSAEALLAQL